jgi:hypothetical protein
MLGNGFSMTVCVCFLSSLPETVFIAGKQRFFQQSFNHPQGLQKVIELLWVGYP